jgi:hypothetical protein
MLPRTAGAACRQKVTQRLDGITVGWRPLVALDADDATRIKGLIERTLQPNVFYEPAFLRAAAALPAARGVGALLVRERGRLIGVLAGRVEGHAHGRPLPTFVAWATSYSPLSVPLVDHERADAAIDALLDELPHLPGGPRLALLPSIEEDGSFARALTDRLYSRAAGMRALDRHSRAAFAPGGDPFAGVSHKKLKELGRLGRRLADTGAVHRASITGDGMEGAVSTYLALEASGWKGRAGTAAGLDPVARAFLVDAVMGLSREGKARVDLLKVDDRIIAAAITLFSRDRAWFWKTAYDESFAHFSPGVLNALALTQSLAVDSRTALVDSCAVADHPMIDRLWSGRIAIADCLVPLSNRRSFALALATERLRRFALRSARFMLNRGGR